MKTVNLLLVFQFCLFSQQLLYSGVCFGTYWNKFPAVTEGVCALNNQKLLSLLNLLCNTTQTTSNQMRDACYGCFFRAGSIINGPTQLTSLNECAKLYIAESNYGSCAVILQAAVDGRIATTVPVAGPCYTGHCDFVQCVRRINAQQLIATCYEESLGERVLEEDKERVEFYTNITSCILAKTRCSQYNPVSGELQNQFYPQKVLANKGPASIAKPSSFGWIGASQSLYYNSLQVSEAGDIRIFTFPISTASVSDLFCSKYPPLQQAGFGNNNC